MSFTVQIRGLGVTVDSIDELSDLIERFGSASQHEKPPERETERPIIPENMIPDNAPVAEPKTTAKAKPTPHDKKPLSQKERIDRWDAIVKYVKESGPVTVGQIREHLNYVVHLPVTTKHLSNWLITRESVPGCRKQRNESTGRWEIVASSDEPKLTKKTVNNKPIHEQPKRGDMEKAHPSEWSKEIRQFMLEKAQGPPVSVAQIDMYFREKYFVTFDGGHLGRWLRHAKGPGGHPQFEILTDGGTYYSYAR